MKKYQYICKLRSDVVISSSTATEGVNPSLDYIPGSKFLGIVARKLYSMDAKKKLATLDIFHNGTVRFGDAHPYLDEEFSLHVPFDWRKQKGKNISSGIFLSHIEEDIQAEELVQMKQIRSGYFSSKGTIYSVDQQFSIRSAYEKSQRRAKEGQIFGYFSLPKGSLWSFEIEDLSGNYLDQINAVISGTHRVGRSRSAEYGLIEIEKLGQKSESLQPKVNILPTTLLYAKSNLAFYNEFGLPDLNPNINALLKPVLDLFDLSEDAKVHWDKSQTRSRPYQTWNQKRQNRNADRFIIQKGSVIAVEFPDTSRLPEVPQEIYVGTHMTEGFGKLLINPSFLISTSKRLNWGFREFEKEQWNKKYAPINLSDQDELLLDILHEKRNRIKFQFDIDAQVNLFVSRYKSKYKGISNSQWGMIRSFAKQANNDQVLYKLLFNSEIGCLQKGQTESVWRQKNRRETLQNFLFSREQPVLDKVALTIRLATEMAKSSSNN